MHMHFSHIPIWRGLSLVMGIIRSGDQAGKEPQGEVSSDPGLVSWCDGARSRREDELARIRQTQSK